MTTTELVHEELPTRAQTEDRGLVSQGCVVKKWVGKYGPYLYRVTKSHGKQTWKYLGRADGLVRGRPASAADSEPIQVEVRE